MVTQGRNILPRRTSESIASSGFFAQERGCIRNALTFDPIIITGLDPSFLMTLFYPLSLSISIYLFSLLMSLTGYVMPLDPIEFAVVYFLLLLYAYVTAFAYKSYLKRPDNPPFLAFVYISMYAITYFPLALFLEMILGPLGSIITFAMVLLSQYNISNSLSIGHGNLTDKDRFLFALLILILQFIFLIGIESCIMSSIRIIKL